MNQLLSWGIKRRKLVVGAMVFSLGVSMYYPVKSSYAEETTSVEKNVELGNVQPAEVTEVPSATQVPVTPEETTAPNTLVIKKKKCSYPKKIYKGQAFTVKGTIKSNHKLKSVEASIVSSEGKEECGVTKKAQSMKFDLSKVDEKMKFSELDAGKYTYEVQVTDTYGNHRTAIKKKFTVKESKWMWPVAGGTLGDGFRCKCSAHGGRHYGVDIKGVSKGTKIRAIRQAEVVYAQYHSGTSKSSFGNLVILYHGNGIYSYYAHCHSMKVKVGDKVEQGDVIATVGATGRTFGTHLHLELRKGPEFNGKYNNYKLLDKYRYKQFNPLKKNYLKYVR
nr:M23 family metallopeptidase [Eubacterium sp.]